MSVPLHNLQSELLFWNCWIVSSGTWSTLIAFCSVHNLIVCVVPVSVSWAATGVSQPLYLVDLATDKELWSAVLYWCACVCVLGAGSAMLGKEGAMACTVAVETVIGEHYDRYICLHYVMDRPILMIVLRYDQLAHWLVEGVHHYWLTCSSRNGWCRLDSGVCKIFWNLA